MVMQIPDDDVFDELVGKALQSFPKKYLEKMDNVAIVYADVPSEAQRQQVGLRPDQTLLGLYEGVPLPARQGLTKVLPDKITLFKLPLVAQCQTIDELAEQIRHTLWHEMAHYFGLDHPQIHALE